jgi:hypothetical protein
MTSLVQEFTCCPAGHAFSHIDPQIVAFLLAAPATIASWIFTFHPELAQQDELHVAVMGVSIQDSADDGRWYGFLPWLLGREGMRMSVTLVGPELAKGFGDLPCTRANTVMTAGYAALQSYSPATLVPVRASQYMRSTAWKGKPDLFFMFNPGLEEFNRQGHWMDDGELNKVCTWGSPIGIGSYAEAEYLAEAWICKIAGLTPGEKHGFNPFCGEKSHAGEWAGYIWELLPRPPVDRFKANEQDRLLYSRYEWLTRVYLQDAEAPPDREIGRVVSCKDVAGQVRHDLVQLPLTDFLVGPCSGIVYERISDDRAAPVCERARIGQELVDTYPKSKPFGFEHVVWALAVHESVFSEEE